MNNLFYILTLLFLTGCSGNEKSTGSKAVDSVKVGVDSTTQSVSVTKASPQRSTVAGSNAWQYEKKVDKEGRTVYKASTLSPNRLEFAFPYNGGSIATLTLRKRESDTHVYVQISKGQFNRSFQDGKARVRFDRNRPITYPISAAENGSANIIFLGSEQTLINRMKAAKKMVIDLEFAGQGTRQIEFQTANLKWEMNSDLKNIGN